MIYWELFFTFLKIGLFAYGGGYAILSLIQHEVEEHGWLTSTEFVDIVAISQMTPGPIGINSATYVGYTATGSVLGSIIATSAIMLPSIALMLIVCKLFYRWSSSENIYVSNAIVGLRWVVLGLIAAAAMLMANGESFVDVWSYVIFGMVLVSSILWKINPIWLIISSGVVGYVLYM